MNGKYTNYCFTELLVLLILSVTSERFEGRVFDSVSLYFDLCCLGLCCSEHEL